MKGERYLDQANKSLVDIAAWLAYSDMPSALAVYEEILSPKMRAADVALLGCLDQFFLCVCILGRRDMIHPWLYDCCREVEADPDGYLDLWAREHYKPTIITWAGVIQEVLIDPELTVAIFSSTRRLKAGRCPIILAPVTFANNTSARAIRLAILGDEFSNEISSSRAYTLGAMTERQPAIQ